MGADFIPSEGRLDTSFSGKEEPTGNAHERNTRRLSGMFKKVFVALWLQMSAVAMMTAAVINIIQ